MAVLFNEFALVFIIIFILSYIIVYFKQPTLIAYIIGGILLGPLFFNILSTSGYYKVLSHIGISFLLFIVGLHLNPKLIREVGLPSIVTGVGQIIVTVVLAIFLLTFLDFSLTVSVIMAIGLAFSSTIVIVKILSDKNTLDTLAGKISLGFLLVQDFVAVLALIGINSFIDFQTGTSIEIILLKVLASFVLAGFLMFSSKYILKFLFEKSQNSELLFLFSIAWSLGIAALFNYLGFSLEIGALIAGIALASTNMHHEISAKIRPLRDFFLIIFFIVLGSEMFASTFAENMEQDPQAIYSLIFQEIIDMLPIAIPLILLVSIGNPIIVFLLLTYLKFPSKISFNAGLAVSQISEFSLIIGLVAMEKGLIGSYEISLLTFIMLVTIMSSSYLYYHSELYFKLLSPILNKINSHSLKKIQQSNDAYDIILTGINTEKENHLFYLHNSKFSFAVIESDPKKIKHLEKKGIAVIRGEITNPEFLQELNFSKLKAFISFDNDDESAFVIVESLLRENPKVQIILKASDLEIANQLYEIGAEYVFVPEILHHDKVFELLKKML